jgi:coenzyme PQQ precursor peptide PqqA
VTCKIRISNSREKTMRWKKPKVKEVCVGLEINDYFPAVLKK